MKEGQLWRAPLQLISRYRSALMGAATLFILFYHCWIKMNLQFWNLAELETNILSVGFVGVEIFLFLSGMGLTRAIAKSKSVWHFYRRRLRRLVFPYVFAVAVYTWSNAQSIKEFMLLLSGIRYVTESIQVFLWYIPAIVILYALFPLYYHFLVRSKNETAFVLNSIGVWMIFTVVFQADIRGDLWALFHRIPVFLLGILSGRWYQTRRVEFQTTHWWGVLISLVLSYQLTRLAIRGRFALLPDMSVCLEAGILGIALILILGAVFERMEACAGVLGKWMRRMVAVLSKIGTFSLEFYCIHEWLYGVIYMNLEGKVSYLQMNFISMPICLLASWMLFCVHRMLWSVIDGISCRIRKKTENAE